MTALPPLKIQIHTLTRHPCALVNRDRDGEAKSIDVGGARRTRISSQAIKRALRDADSHPFALSALGEIGVRSRSALRHLAGPELVAAGHDPHAVVAVLRAYQTELYGRAPETDSAHAGADPLSVLERPEPVTLGPAEIRHLTAEAAAVLAKAPEPKAAAKAAEKRIKETKANLRAMNAAGVDAYLFGRMVTGDLFSRLDGAAQIAHQMTVHAEQAVDDAFACVDDVWRQGAVAHQGAAHINSAPLTSGLYYGYAALDAVQLIANAAGLPRARAGEGDRDLPARLAEALVQLLATVSPGGKRGQTASWAAADLVLVELGVACNRSLMGAFEIPAAPTLEAAATALGTHLEAADAMRGRRELRYLATTAAGATIPGAERIDLNGLAALAGEALRDLEAVAAALPKPAAARPRPWAAAA